MRTSTTGKCSKFGGFTLLELLVAMALMGLLTAVAMPKLAAFLRGDELRASAAKAIGLARECGIRARQERRDYELRYDAASHALIAVAAGDKTGAKIRPLKLPENLGRVDFVTASGKPAPGLRFSAQGYATPGLVTLAAPDGRALSLAVSPFLGRIDAHEGRPDPAGLFR